MKRIMFLLFTLLFLASPALALDIGEFNEDVRGKTGTETLYKFKSKTQDKTASYTMTDADSGTWLTNVGAGADITITWGAREVGCIVCIADSAAAAHTIAVNPPDTVQILNETNAAGNQISSTAQGDSICLIQVSSTAIQVVGTVGTWDDED